MIGMTTSVRRRWIAWRSNDPPGLEGIAGLDHAVAFGGQHVTNEAPHIRVVVDHENRLALRLGVHVGHGPGLRPRAL
jgi:hypothetical protein